METQNVDAAEQLKEMKELMNSEERTMIDMQDDEGRLVQQIEYKLGVPDGRGITYNPETGNKIQEMNFLNGKLHGEMIIYDQLSDIAAKLTYFEGGLNGPCEFYVDGKMILSGHYKDGKYDGVLTYYDTFLNIIKEENYQNGLKEGKVISYSPNKQILKSESYKAGKLNGVTVTFYPDKENAMHEYAEYSNGELHGTTKVFYDDGNLQEIRLYSNGKIIGEVKKYDREGNLLS